MDGNKVSSDVAVVRWRAGNCERASDTVAEEVPVALVYNGISHAVMLATPADLEDFALGFSLTEGIVGGPGDVYDCEIVEAENGIRVELTIASESFGNLKMRRRNLAGRTGCGLCGTVSLSQAVRILPVVQHAPVFAVDVVRVAFDDMEKRQMLKMKTGATHAAAWLDMDGAVSFVREDVGRHNALDKMIGAMAAKGKDFARGAVLVTSRASYEMVQKCAMAGVGMLAAVSAPTALAIRMADRANITLAGFVRKNGLSVYTHSHRLT